MMACEDYYQLGTRLPSLPWNLDDLGALGGAEFGTGVGILDEHVSLVVHPSEASTGYLEDAVTQWSERCKRRRTLVFSQAPAATEGGGVEDLVQSFWNSNCHFDTFAASPGSLTEKNVVTNDNTRKECLPDDPSLYLIPMEEANAAKLVSEHELFSSSSSTASSSSSSSCKEHTTAKASVDNVHGKRALASAATAPPPSSAVFHELGCFPAREGEDPQPKKKKVTTRVVYPFAVVRPGGVDGSVTLKDINRRLLMRPTKPVRHPVGEFACHPCVSGDGPGLSGKAVVGLTRIHTRGRGTITIIRTKD